MKTSFFKYIFILFILGIIVGAIYFIYFKDEKESGEIIQVETVEEVENKKDLRLGISNYDNINPLISNNKEILNIDRLIFEPLVNITNDYEIENCLASEVSKISDTSYIVKIDNEIKWNNGTPLISKDIQFTIDRLKEGRSIYSYNVEKVVSVEVIDSSTVRINLSEPVSFFEYNLTFPILSSSYYIGEDFYNTTKTPIGTGMYKIVSMEQGSIILGKNDKWWNIEKYNPKIEAVNIKIFSEIGEVYNSFKLGNIDFLTSANTNLENYIGTIGYAKQEFMGRALDYLAFNLENDILKHTEVRKAIGCAIDKNNIVSATLNNNYNVSNFPLDYGSFLYNNDLYKIEYNQDQAKRFLIENGWEFKNKRWQKKENYRTRKIDLSITVSKDDQRRVKVAENIKAQLEKVGFRITINKVSADNYKSILEKKNYEMILTGIYNSYSPNIETFFGNNNLQNYNNQEVRTILNEVKNINDENKLKEKYNRLLEIYNNELPFLCLYRDTITVARNQTLAGEITPNNYFSYYNIHTWFRM